MKRQTAKTYSKLTKQFHLSEDALKSLRRCALGVWQEIGCDVLDAMGKETGKGDGVTMSKAHVIELVIDADRLQSEVMRRGHSDLKVEWTRWCGRWPDANSTEWYDYVEGYLKKEVFQFARYGF